MTKHPTPDMAGGGQWFWKSMPFWRRSFSGDSFAGSISLALTDQPSHERLVHNRSLGPIIESHCLRQLCHRLHLLGTDC